MDEITAISALILGIALLLCVISAALAHQHHLLRGVQYLIFSSYVFVNLYETLLFRMVTPDAQYELGFLWSYREALGVHIGSGNEVRILITDSGLLKEIILNILLYIPLGYLLPVTWPKLAEKATSKSRSTLFRWITNMPWKIVLIGLLCSTVTEITQLVFHLGLFEFDDILNNTIGCAIGMMIYWFFMKNRMRRRKPHFPCA